MSHQSQRQGYRQRISLDLQRSHSPPRQVCLPKPLQHHTDDDYMNMAAS